MAGQPWLLGFHLLPCFIHTLWLLSSTPHAMTVVCRYKAREIEVMREKLPLGLLATLVKSAEPARDFKAAILKRAKETGGPAQPATSCLPARIRHVGGRRRMPSRCRRPTGMGYGSVFRGGMACGGGIGGERGAAVKAGEGLARGVDGVRGRGRGRRAMEDQMRIQAGSRELHGGIGLLHV